MIPIIEDVLTQIIESRLKYLKDNVDIVDRIFPTATLTSKNRLKEYISGNTIKVIRGFPRDQNQLPAYVILLGGEQEQEENIGTFMDDSEDDYTTESISEVRKVKRQDGYYIVQTQSKPIFSVESLIFNGQQYYSDFFEVIDHNKGIIQLKGIAVQTYDDVQVNFTRISSGSELYGTMYNSQYRIETWTNNGDLTVILYHLLKWVFLTARDELVSNGLVRQTLGGADFEPAPEYFPEFVYRRALSFSVMNEVSVNLDTDFVYISNIIDETISHEGE